MAWAAMLRLAMRDLGLRPEDFWALTPVEFAIFAGIEAGSAPLTRSVLAALEAEYPDKGEPS